MKDVIGIAWFKDEPTYRRALAIFSDAKNMPATYQEWKGLVERQLKEIKDGGNTAIRVDIEPDTFIDWCNLRGFQPNSQARIAYVNHVELEYRKTGQGTVVE